MEGVFCAVMTLVEKGDEVIMFTPCFPSYIELVRLAGGTPVFSHLSASGWKLDISDVRKKITKKTKAMIICNPNNPTGTVYARNELLELSRIAEENGAFIISDDPYNFLVFEGEYFSLASVDRFRKNLVACFSFSKEFAMTGYRVGYSIAPEGILNQMMKVHDASTICAPCISQQAAIFALEEQGSSKAIIEALTVNREIMIDGLDKIKSISYVKPNGAYYVLVKYSGKKNSMETALDILEKVHVEVVPGSAFGPAGEGHLRLSFGGRPESIKEGLKRLGRYFGVRL
jgi:aminotransferase